jgi:phosphatidylserine/phosphatidylglycerophosphate/cardiolipin synthase-like enzyme
LRQRVTSKEGLTVQAIAGTYVVLLGFDIAPEQRKGLLGFAVYRVDLTEQESYYLPGGITFPGVSPGPHSVSTHDFPLQKFRWGDYTAKPDHHYQYRIEALYGQPDALKTGDSVAIEVQTENPLQLGGGKHQIHFNRSCAASQAYVRKFGSVDPRDVPDGAAFRWLSRGLEESLAAFIERARDETFSLHLCIYEFQKDSFLDALRQAADRHVRVEIIYDAIQNTNGPREANQEAIRRHGLADYCHPRTNITAISHHKFIVLAQHGDPLAVWTGSTNFTDGAIYGQANVGHAIEDKDLAGIFLQLHQRLLHDPNITDSRGITEALSPVPPSPDASSDLASCYPIFSPRSTVIALDTCADLIHNAQQLVCFSAPFGLDRRINAVLDDADHQFLAFGLLNTPDNKVEAVHRTASDRFVSPAHIATPLDNFQVESLHHKGVYVHTKLIVIDPFSAHPIVVTGSANFSRNSSLNNDENQLIIIDQPTVADVYLGEFMRMYDHYTFRFFLAHAQAGQVENFLRTDDSWADKYFNNALEQRDRLIFSGREAS